jgi:SAM-dependent methyltransferase
VVQRRPHTLDKGLAGAPSDNESEWRRWNDDSWILAWQQREPLTRPAGQPSLDALSPRRGEHLLDVGCGGGLTTIEAARMVAPEGRVSGVDLSDRLVELARRRAETADAANVSFAVADAQVGRLAGRPFDAALSSFGVMFFDRPVTAFANIAAHLRPGARLAFACWQSARRNPWNVRYPLRHLVASPPAPIEGPVPPGPFSLADADWTASLLATTGFVEVASEEMETVVRGPASLVYDEAELVLLGVPAQHHAEAVTLARRHVEQFRTSDGGYEFPIAFAIWRARLR